MTLPTYLSEVRARSEATQSMSGGHYPIASAADDIQKLLAIVDCLRGAIGAVHENASELQPNSGHMYLANVNYCYKKTSEAIKQADAIAAGGRER